MAQDNPNSATGPLFSIIIATYNDWVPLDRCLRSLIQQTDGPSFEVVVVDDGSSEEAPEFVRQWIHHYPLTIVRQPHAGVAAARNQAIRISKGDILVCVDSDCKVQPDCLAGLATTIATSPQHDCFQLHLIGDCGGIVGRAEHLRLAALQNLMLQPNGCIRYLNTAGFAIRRNRVDVQAGLFDTIALRAEDTLLLASLIEGNELPLFVSHATVQHAIVLSLKGYIRKAIRSAYLEASTYDIIAAKSVRIRVSHRERLRMMRFMWEAARNPMIGKSAWLVLVVKQAIQRAISFAYRCLPLRSTRPIRQVFPEKYHPIHLKVENRRIAPR